MNKIKFDNKTLEDVFEQLALGKSVKSVLDEKNLSYEGLRKLMRKKPKIRQLYEEAKEDGIDYLLSNNIDLLNKTVDEFKANGKGDLAITNLLKEITNLNRWKASKLLPKYNDNAQKLQLSNADNKPLIVKWSKD
ncbi:DNA binding protein [uncultured Mediterranean phage uvMED]|jgi:hypothetical protein|nr:DNA binding protein [uncultured Mediterranean phage uvMED]